MTDLDREYASKIKHRIASEQRRQKKTELVFLFSVLTMLSFLAGYLVGSKYPHTPSAKPWAEKVGRVKK